MMRYVNLLGLCLLAAAVGGCGPDTEQSKAGGGSAGSSQKQDDHDHGPGPNGGVVFDLGKYHAEFTVDHDKKECTVLVMGDDEKTPVAVAAKDLTLTTKETKTKDGQAVPPLTIQLTPTDEKNGKATKFAGTDPGLGNVADFAGTVTGMIDGKPSSGTFKE